MDASEYKTLFADVVAPVPVEGTFSYRVPQELNDEIKVGQRVAVQFGPKKVISAIVVRISEDVPKVTNIKYILGILDPQPVVNNIQLEFWKWVSQYYMCYVGEVMHAALPPALKLSSESAIRLSPAFVLDSEPLNDYEYLIVEALRTQPRLTVSEVTKIVNYNKVMPLIKTMIDKHIIIMEEELEEKYKARTETFVALAPEYASDESMSALMDKLNKSAPKQLDVLMAFVMLGGGLENDVARTALLKRASATSSILNALVDKGVFKIFQRETSRLGGFAKQKDVEQIELSPAQQTAYESVNEGFAEGKTVLLNGVTSSGKTEIYIKLIQNAISKGRQVLYLLPEIALTEHIIKRLQTYFGGKAGVYHSRSGDNERVEVWKRVAAFDPESDQGHQIIIGSRSALFLPFSDLGLIVVDEEHDSSFKQTDPAPRYNARDCSVVLASMHKANIVLGSATPSYESYFNALTGKYKLVRLTERYGGYDLPKTIVCDMREETRRKTVSSHFGKPLLTALRSALDEKKQAILFQNRRGFAPRLECGVCNHIPQCVNCDVSLIYHKHSNTLRCHYCGYSIPVPHECPQCGSTDIRTHGFGTEKIEEELSFLLPDASIARLDLDTSRSKNAYHNILDSFDSLRTDILVGTQMVTKGLDFGNVKVVGILNADGMLSYPDFRAYERAFQLMEQVSGRAGRKGGDSLVVIQSFQPTHPVITNVIGNTYDKLFQEQMTERKQFSYPPFCRLILIKLRHADPDKLNIAADKLAALLKPVFGQRVLGPEYPIVSRIKNLYIKQFIIKFGRTTNPAKVKALVAECLNKFSADRTTKSVSVQIDVDPA